MCASVKCYIRACSSQQAGLIISKKRQQLMADNVDDISLLGCHYKDNGWENQQRDPSVFYRWKEKRIEEESQMAA